jgi:hypothetical protein
MPNKKSIKFTEKQIPKKEVLEMKLYYEQTEVPHLKNHLLSKINLI